jgi:hypothetical protein
MIVLSGGGDFRADDGLDKRRVLPVRQFTLVAKVSEFGNIDACADLLKRLVRNLSTQMVHQLGFRLG